MEEVGSPDPAYMDAPEMDAPFVTGLSSAPTARSSSARSSRPASPADRDGSAPRQPGLLHRQPALHRPRASSNLSDTSARAQQRRRELGLASPGSMPTSPTTSISFASEPVHRQGSLRSQVSACSRPRTPTSPNITTSRRSSVSENSVYSDDDAVSAVPSLHRSLSGQSRVSAHSQGSATRSPTMSSSRSASGPRALFRRSEAPPVPSRPASLSGASSPRPQTSSTSHHSPPVSPHMSPRVQHTSLPAADASPALQDTEALHVPAVGASASSESLSSAYSEDEGRAHAPPPRPAAAAPHALGVASPPVPGPGSPAFHPPPSTSTPRMPSQSTAPSSRTASATGSSMRSPASDTMQDLFDTFASALADLGLNDAPMEGLNDVDVQYRPAAYPGGSHGLPSSASTLASLLPPSSEQGEPRAAPDGAGLPGASARRAMPTTMGAPKALGTTSAAPAASAASASATPTSPPDQLDVYGLSVWWPGSFDISTNVNYDSVTNRALLYADAANDLLTRPTHLDVWMERARKQRPNAPDALTMMVMQEQVRALDAQLAPSEDAVSSPADLPLPANIPYPLLAKAQSAAHSDPGLVLATPASTAKSMRRPNASTLMHSLHQLGRRKTPLLTGAARMTPATVSPAMLSTASATPAASTPALTPKAAAPVAPALPPRLTPWASDATMGLGILSRTPSAMSMGASGPDRSSIPEAQLQVALARVRDALPDIDEGTARRYLMRHQGDDVRAITDYVQEHAREEAPYRRGLFRTPRAR
ncbi:hypothetical protein MEQU1_001709 [Malassezia equina]|uniref:Uncharacterized protein n=1 Tax=Malassezia equina TaxID=1381935 RepID=A0AAF0ECE5_9BASI|nr:hypothetical protein MEQU1_001709 [Malassezia equina]